MAEKSAVKKIADEMFNLVRVSKPLSFKMTTTSVDTTTVVQFWTIMAKTTSQLFGEVLCT